jgi:hypothetical protein
VNKKCLVTETCTLFENQLNCCEVRNMNKSNKNINNNNLTRAQDQPSGISSDGDIPKVPSDKKIKALGRFETSVTVSSAHCVNSPHTAKFQQHSVLRLR